MKDLLTALQAVVAGIAITAFAYWLMNKIIHLLPEKIKKKENKIPIIELFDSFDKVYEFTFDKYSEIFHSLNYNYKIIKIDSIYVAKFFKVEKRFFIPMLLFRVDFRLLK